MLNLKSFRLLTKTTIIYLIFIVLTFFITARFLKQKSDRYLTEQSEHFFRHREHKALWILLNSEKEGDEKLAEKVKDFHSLQEIPVASDTLNKNYPIYKDSLIYDQEMAEYHLHRMKTVLLKTNTRIYEYTMSLNIDDFNKLKLELIKNSREAFSILALTVVLFSFLLSSFLLKPFNKILQEMNEYKVGKPIGNLLVRTTTKEFVRMQQLFKKMVLRTDNDYRKLKEYTENMAHEIQTPLAIIRNKSEILIADESVMDKHTGTVKAIYDEANHLSNLGTALNLLTKIENGEYNNIIQVHTHDIIERHIESVKEIIELKSLKVELQLSEEHSLLLDPFLFEILLKNLVRNAIRYGTNQGPIKIVTTADRFAISNYGEPLNISPDKIFERFYTGNTSSSSLGLGLSLVKKICDLNQLSIEYNYKDSQHIFEIFKTNG